MAVIGNTEQQHISSCSQSRSIALHFILATEWTGLPKSKWKSIFRWWLFVKPPSLSFLTALHQILPLASRKQTGISFHCELFKVPWPRCSLSRTVNEQTPQLPRASALITPIQQNGPSNCPDRYNLFCVQKCTILPHCFQGNWKFLWPIKSCYSCNRSEARRLFVSMAGCWAIYRSI